MLVVTIRLIKFPWNAVAPDDSVIKQHPIRAPAFPNPSPVVLKSSGLECKTMARPRIWKIYLDLKKISQMEAKVPSFGWTTDAYFWRKSPHYSIFA